MPESAWYFNVTYRAIYQLLVKNVYKTVNVGRGHLKCQNIRQSETRFKAPIRAILTRPELHKTVQNSSINGEKSV